MLYLHSLYLNLFFDFDIKLMNTNRQICWSAASSEKSASSSGIYKKILSQKLAEENAKYDAIINQ